MVKWKSLLATSLVIGAVLVAGCGKKEAEETKPAVADSTSMAPADTVAPAMPVATATTTTNSADNGSSKVTTTRKSRVKVAKQSSHRTPAVPVAQERPRAIMVPAGTTITVALNDEISSKTAHDGDAFTGRLTEAVVIDGRTAFPQGATVEGHVANSVRGGGKDSKRAHLQLAYDRVVVEGLSTALSTTGADIVGKSGTKGDVERIGGGAAAGAGLGALLGGGKGAAKGAIIGGVAGTAASMLAHAPDVKVEAGSVQSVRLDHTVMVGERAVEAARK